MSKIKAEILDRIRRNDPELKSLALSIAQLDDSDIAILVEALQTNTHLTSLDVSYNEIGDEGAKALVSNIHLTTLNVSGNNIGDEGAKALASNTYLTSLDISCNKIGDEGAKAFARNTHLTSLNASYNKIGAVGAKALASNTHLTFLHIYSNYIGDEGAEALASNTHLTFLHLYSNNIRDKGAQAFTSNTHLTFLDVTGNYISPQVLKELSRAIHLNKKTKELKFIEQVMEVAIGTHPSQASLLKTLPSDLLLIVLSYVADNAISDPKEVTDVCKTLLQTFKSTSTGKLDWYQAKTKFFQTWDKTELQAIKDRAVKQTVKQPESGSSAQQQTSGENTFPLKKP